MENSHQNSSNPTLVALAKRAFKYISNVDSVEHLNQHEFEAYALANQLLWYARHNLNEDDYNSCIKD